ncbi:MAG: Ig-like domain-containing protein [candidate division WOR-3 bacterium]|nr:MAG: Ig-like domain-containing protein [candidate division WOR-3 bacterium]
MKKFFVLSFAILLAFLCFCRKPEKKIDIVTQRTLLMQDTIPLEITHISPIGRVEGVRETFRILVGFNQPMVPLQAIPREEIEGPLQIDPAIKGKYRWFGSRTLAFIPSDSLQPATEFHVTLKKEKIQSLTGMRLDRDTSWIFESVRPLLISSLPYHGSQFMDTEADIYLSFNIEMAPERVADKITLSATHGMPSKVYCGTVQPKSLPIKKEISFRARHLRDEEKKDWPMKNWENNRTLVLEPVDGLPIEALISVQIHPGLRAKTGELGTIEDKMLTFNTYNYFGLLNYSTTIPAGEPLSFCFSNRVQIRELMKHMSIEPAVEIPKEYQDAEWDGMRIDLYVPFQPNTNYRIRVERALTDIYGNRLDKDYAFDLKVDDYTPYAYIPTGVNIVERVIDYRFPATFVNVDSVYMETGVVNIDNAIPFLNTKNLFDSYSKCVPVPGFFNISRYWKVNTYKNYRNKRITFPIELREILGTKQAGLVFIEFDNLGQSRYSSKSRYLKSFIEVSDIGVTWKYAPENNFVWITSLYDTRPMKNARVQFRDNKNRILREAITNESGLCELPGWAEQRLRQEQRTYEYEEEYELYSYTARYEPRFWLTVTKGEDVAIYSNKWNFGIDLWRFNIPYNWYIRSEEYGAHIFTEKGLYRSGETVHMKGMLRKKRRGEWVLPDLSSVYFIVRNSRDEEIVFDTLTINQYGSFTKDIQLSEDAPTGVYSVNVMLPDRDYDFYHSFRVEAYRPVEFEVIVTAEKDTFIAEETFKGNITGRYLFGMPMKDAEMSWSLRRDYYYLRYPQHEGYRFGERVEDRERELLGSGTGKLDKDGEYRVSVRLSKEDIYTTSSITLEGTVVAPNKMSVSKTQNWIAFNADVLIGLKTSQYVYVLGDSVDINLITVKPSGEKIGDKKVSVEIVKQEWKSIKKARLGGRFEWVSEKIEKKIAKQDVVSIPDSTIVPITPREPGYYYARAYTKDKRGRISTTKIYFYVAGYGYAGWQMRDDDIIELVADREQYEVGDTAKILVQSPYDSAQCLVTVERELVLRSFTKTVRGNADYVEIPIQSSDIPNVYVSVTLLRGRVKGLTWDEEAQEDLGKPQFKIGYVNLTIDTKEKHLTVKTWADKKDYRPRDSVTVYLEVNDYKNQGVAQSEVALFVVDVGVLNLIDFRTPDPFSYFYGSRALSVKTIESRLNILGERSYGEKGEERGGGGLEAEGVAYREKFIATVFYKADVRTDKNGRARVRFQLPDNLTKFRIMAVAQTRDAKFGSADSTFVVNLPFILTPSIPRFVRVGDAFKAGIVLHNRTDGEERASVECTVTGLRLADKDMKETVLPPNGSREIVFSFVAEDTGAAVFEFSARMGKEKDALRLAIPVTLPPFIEAVATFSSTNDSTLEGIVVPSSIYENIGSLDISLSSSILAGMQRGIEHLLNFPYDCLEQKLSRILPLIVGEDIINQFKLASVTGKELRNTVQAVLDEVPEYQLPDGGFVCFKDALYPSPYLSAYTMYVLWRASQNGYRIDDVIVEHGIEYLKEILRLSTAAAIDTIVKDGKTYYRSVLTEDERDWSYPYNLNERLATKAFCLYSLAVWGQKEKSYASKLFEYREQLPIFGKTLLLKTGRVFGMGSSFQNELARILVNKIKLTPTTAHFEESENRGWTFPSPAKVTAFVMQTMTELDIPFPYKDQTIRWLVQERTKKSLPTTHENAFVFDAFQTYYKKYEKEEPDFVSRVLLGGKEIIQQNFRGRTNEPPRRYTFPLGPILKDTLVPLKITKQGEGRLYYTVRMSYALRENPIPFDEGFYIWKEMLTLDGKEVRRFKRGEVYKVVLHIVVPETRLFAVVDDPLPAGFVPVQTFFATEAQEVRERYWEEQWQERGHWWGSFDHEEKYDDKVLFFAQQLFPGEHTKVYFVRAATTGSFLAPSTKAEEMYAPEVFGSTTQDYIVVE